MIKYLDLFEKDMKKHNADYFVEQIQLYKNMYTHYKNTSCPSPIYTGILNHGDTHCFYFPTNENVNLTWDVDLIYIFLILPISDLTQLARSLPPLQAER